MGAEGVKAVHEDLNEVLEELIASGKYVLDPVAERLNMTKYKKIQGRFERVGTYKRKVVCQSISDPPPAVPSEHPGRASPLLPTLIGGQANDVVRLRTFCHVALQVAL